MSFEYKIASAVDGSVDACRTMREADQKTTILYGQTLLLMQKAWNALLQKDVQQITDDQTNPDWDAQKRSQEMKKDEAQYQNDGTEQKQQTNTFQGALDAQKQNVSNDANHEKTYMSLEDTVVTLSGTSESLAAQKF